MDKRNHPFSKDLLMSLCFYVLCKPSVCTFSIGNGQRGYGQMGECPRTNGLSLWRNNAELAMQGIGWAALPITVMQLRLADRCECIEIMKAETVIPRLSLASNIRLVASDDEFVDCLQGDEELNK